MLGIVLKILSIFGIVLLVVLALVLLGTLLFLFFPFTYEVQGSKDQERGLRLSLKASWLFGLFRVRFGYPQPGRLTVKVLWFSLFDMQIPPEKKTAEKEPEESEAETSPKEHGTAPESAIEPHTQKKSGKIGIFRHEASESTNADTASEVPPSSSEPGFFGKISQKFQKIKYTIYNIYDKIKKIWENISYYIELLQEDNTKQLAAHALFRAGKILKSIRPRRMKVQLVFGMDSPDTTGYLYGTYCILAATIGPGVQITPDFEKKRFEGEFDIAGHIVIWVFVINGLKLVLDRRLRLFLKKLKAGLKKLEKAPV